METRSSPGAAEEGPGPCEQSVAHRGSSQPRVLATCGLRSSGQTQRRRWEYCLISPRPSSSRGAPCSTGGPLKPGLGSPRIHLHTGPHAGYMPASVTLPPSPFALCPQTTGLSTLASQSRGTHKGKEIPEHVSRAHRRSTGARTLTSCPRNCCVQEEAGPVAWSTLAGPVSTGDSHCWVLVCM